MKIKEESYSSGIVCFLDILGFKSVAEKEDNFKLLKRITTYEISYALERCKNSVRNEELVINKLIKYIETKIEDADY